MLRVLMMTLLLGSAALAQSPAEKRLRELIPHLPAADQQTVRKAVFAGEYRLGSLVGFHNADGRLLARFHLPDELVGQFHDPDPLLIALEGSPHLWLIHRRKAGTLDTGLSMITLTCLAPDMAWPFNRFTIGSDGFSAFVTASQMLGNPSYQPYLSLTQGERAIQVACRLDTDKYVPKKIDVADVSQLPSRAGALFENYLLPVLRELGPARPASDVYRVFDQIPADPDMQKRIVPLVARLDSDDSSVRLAAQKQLESMGRAAILACLRLDRSGLTVEQSSRLFAFYAGEGWFHIEDVEAARRDPAFLAACEADEDPAVRTAASLQLAAIRAARLTKQNR